MPIENKAEKGLVGLYVDMPTAVAKKIRTRAIQEGLTLKATIIKAVEHYLRTTVPEPIPIPPPPVPVSSAETIDGRAVLQTAGETSLRDADMALTRNLAALSDAEFDRLLHILHSPGLIEVARMGRSGITKDEMGRRTGRSLRTITARFDAVAQQLRELSQ